MKILVTGASGFIGRHLVTHLAAMHEVIALTRSEAHAESNRRWATVTMDLAAPLETRLLPARVDVIISLAQANVTFPESADSLFAVNTAAVQHLLDYARGAETRRFVLASTGDVYGTRSGKCLESDDVFPKSFYAVTKYGAELLTAPYSDYFSSCVLRLFQPYGPGQSGRLMQRLADRIQHGQPIRINLENRPRLSPIYITDVNAAFEAASQCDWSGVVNVAGDTIVDIRELSERISAVLGFAPVFEETGEEVGDLMGDNSRMKEVLEVLASVGLDEGLARTFSTHAAI